MEDCGMTQKASVTYYGTSYNGRVAKYQCAACEGDLVSRDTHSARILECTGCGCMVGFAKQLPPYRMQGQQELEL
jgi:ribosomal protein L37AE/L43A